MPILRILCGVKSKDSFTIEDDELLEEKYSDEEQEVRLPDVKESMENIILYETSSVLSFFCVFVVVTKLQKVLRISNDRSKHIPIKLCCNKQMLTYKTTRRQN